MRRLFYIIVCLVYSSKILAQDGVFTQIIHNKLYLNPALVGNDDETSLSLNSRQQWINVPSAFVGSHSFNQASFQSYCQDYNIGYGIQVRNSIEGDGLLQTNEINIYYSKRILSRKLGDVQFGISNGLSQKTINWEQLAFTSQYHPYIGKYRDQALVNPQLESSNFSVDLSTGLRWRKFQKIKNTNYSNLYSAGVALFHFNRPYESFFGLNNRLNQRLNVYVNYGHIFRPYRKNKVYYTSFSAIFDYQNPLSTSTLMFGQQLGDYSFVNVGYRARHFFEINNKTDALLFAMNFNYDRYVLGISYDHTVNGLTNGRTMGTIEVALRIPINYEFCPRSNQGRGEQCEFMKEVQQLPANNYVLLSY